MREYPATLMEFESQFKIEEDCIDYLVQMWWPKGFICPACEGHKAWRTDRKLFHCASCELVDLQSDRRGSDHSPMPTSGRAALKASRSAESYLAFTNTSVLSS